MRALRWTLAAVYAASLFYVSSLPSEEIPLGMPYHMDKVAHAVAYALLALLVCRAWRDPGTGSLVLIALLCAAYGVFNEMHQAYVPGRYTSAGDAVANAVGAFAMALLWPRLRRSSPQSDG
jgi:VanZ family protein